MAKEYCKDNIEKTYYAIEMGISGLDNYEEIGEEHNDLITACKRVVEMIELDKDFKDEPKWSYLVVKHEEDDDTDWTTAYYKVYKYRGKWKYKRVDF